MSICDGPPYIHTKSTCLAFAGRLASAWARARNSSGTVRPKNVAPPIRNTSRRLYWWYARQPGFMGSFPLSMRLVVHLKFAGVHEAPEDLFQAASQRVGRIKVLHPRFQFLGSREPTQRTQEQFFQPLLVGQAIVAGQLGHPSAASADLGAHLLVVSQEQQLRQRHVVALFAVALHVGPPNLPPENEVAKGIADVVEGVDVHHDPRAEDRPLAFAEHPSSRVLLFCAGGLVQDVEDDLAWKAAELELRVSAPLQG